MTTTTQNALDPPRARRPRPPHRRIVAIVVGVVIAVGVIFALVHFLHPAAAGRDGAGGRDGFDRAGFSGSGGATPEPPPAVTPETAATTSANIKAAQRAAESPALAAHPVQVATVSPPAGRPARGLGVTHSDVQIGPSDG